MAQKIRKTTAFSIILSLALFIFISGAGAQSVQKSPAKALLYSLLVPGLGQKYVDNIGSARYALAAEAVLFGFAAGYEVYSNWLEEDYRTFAAAHSGILPQGKSKSYFVAVSRYSSIYQYNDKMRIFRELDAIIPETPSNIWVWDSEDNQYFFYDRRLQAERMHNRTKYFYSAIVLNHLISGIHAAIKAKRHNAQKGGSNWNLTIAPLYDFRYETVTLHINLRY